MVRLFAMSLSMVTTAMHIYADQDYQFYLDCVQGEGADAFVTDSFDLALEIC